MLLFRVGGFLALLGFAAFVLMLIVKLIVTALIVLSIGALAFKIISKKRRHLLAFQCAEQPIGPQQTFSNSKIQPIYGNTKSNKTIIPIL